MRNASHIGAEQNHLWPVIAYGCPAPRLSIGTACVVFARRSEPPCFSVIAMPTSADFFCDGAMTRESYEDDVTRGTHSAARPGADCSAGTQAVAIDSGQQCPASTIADNMNRAERATHAPG